MSMQIWLHYPQLLILFYHAKGAEMYISGSVEG
jgi:hypothetical protein